MLNDLLPLRPYDVLLLDPPWLYAARNKHGRMRSIERHYETMKKEELFSLDIKSIAAPRASLFLWVTAPHMDTGIDLLRHWGFRFTSVAFTWVKLTRSAARERNWLRPVEDDRNFHKGNGFNTRGNTEFVLMGKLGRTSLPILDKGVRSLIVAPVGKKHSAKPVELHRRIEALHGDQHRAEFFARRLQSGWDCYGNEINGCDVRDDLQLIRDRIALYREEKENERHPV